MKSVSKIIVELPVGICLGYFSATSILANMKPFYFALIFATLVVMGCHASQESNRVLVLMGSGSIQHSHSKYFSSLQQRGYKLTYSSTEHPSQTLSEYGKYLFDHLIIFAPHIDDFSGVIDAQAIIDFVDAGHNVLIAAAEGVSHPIREIASKMGVDFADKGQAALDHFYHDLSGEEHDHLIVDSLKGMKRILGTEQVKYVLYEGTSQTLDPKRVKDGLLFPILEAKSTAYPAPHVNLVAALQARNNARVVISGSLSLFSNAFWDSNLSPSTAAGGDKASTTIVSGNKQLITELTAWNFGERSILRASPIVHHRPGEKIAPALYTIKDNITVSTRIEELSNGKWIPFVAKGLQVEFIMLDPYVRQDMTHTENGIHQASFAAPDTIGVYTFEIDYKSFGYSHLFLQERTPVRPFKHNEYERFLVAAYPYYAAAFSMIAGVILLGLVVLYQKS